MTEGSEQQIHIDQAFLDDLTKKHEEAFESTLRLKDSPEWKLKKKDGDLFIYVRKDTIEKFDQIMSVISMPYTTEEIMSKIRPLDLIDEHTPKHERHGIAGRKILWEQEKDIKQGSNALIDDLENEIISESAAQIEKLPTLQNAKYNSYLESRITNKKIY